MGIGNRKLVKVLLFVAVALVGLSLSTRVDWGIQSANAQQLVGITGGSESDDHDGHPHGGEVELVVREEITGGVPCLAGFAGPYPCKNVDLLSFLPLNPLVGGSGAEVWGWTDPETGKEYVIASQTTAVSFVDISDPLNPTLVGTLPAPVPNILWRDVKVYDNHVYVVADGSFVDTHGLQIFDLTQLRDVAVTPTVFEETARYTGEDSGLGTFNDAHNIAINPETATGYVVAPDFCNRGLWMIDLSQPAAPKSIGCLEEEGTPSPPGEGQIHDTLCVTYRGPDADFQEREICINAGEDAVSIFDVTDKSNPVMLARTEYEGGAYAHQGWLTEDHAYFVLGDELDEMDNGHNTRSYIFDLRDLEAPQHIGTYEGPSTAIDHNLYLRDGFVFEANYTSGLRILDGSDIAQGKLSEVAYFDTHPASDAATFAGSWGNYPFFESGVVAVNNLEDGLYIVKPNLPAPPFRSGEASGGGWLRSSDDQKVEFQFNAEKSDAGTSGSLTLADSSEGVSIDVADVTSLGNVSGECGSVAAGQLSLELRGTGTFNGNPAEFRACFQDTHDPGKNVDRFYLECTAGCTYNSGARTDDDVIDGGNIKVKRDG